MTNRLLLVAAALTFACAEQPVADPLTNCKGVCGAQNPLFAMSTMTFVGEAHDHTSLGFDLDHVVGPSREDCQPDDYTSPDGTPGIDNQLARLLPLLLQAIGEALPTLLQHAIDDGGLSLLFEVIPPVEGQTGPTLAFHRASGAPLLATDGHLLSGQTYAITPEPPVTFCRNAVVTGNHIDCAGFDLPLAIVVFGILYDFRFRDTRVAIDFDDARENAHILVGGAVKISDIYDITDHIVDGPAQLSNIVHSALPPLADIIGPDTDECDRMSGTVEMTARVAFAQP